MSIYDKYTERELYDMYDERLDDGMVNICGYESPSMALRRVDYTAYDVGFSNFCAMLEEDDE